MSGSELTSAWSRLTDARVAVCQAESTLIETQRKLTTALDELAVATDDVIFASERKGAALIDRMSIASLLMDYYGGSTEAALEVADDVLARAEQVSA